MNISAKTNYAFIHPPEHFTPCATVVSLLCWADNKCLFLQKAAGHQKDRWGLPGGKIERGETLVSAMQRELIEETGLFIPVANMTAVGHAYMRNKVDYEIHLFATELPRQLSIYLSKEHSAAQWLSLPEALELPLLAGQDEILNYFCLGLNV